MEFEIYVGTYKKYNNGDLSGDWLKLEDYADLDEFYEACHEIHKDEESPELMFQDWVDIPHALMTEDWIHKEIYKLVELDEDDREMVADYIDAIGLGPDLEEQIQEAQDNYMGQYRDTEEFAESVVDDFFDIPDNIRSYFDITAFARDLFMDYTFHNGRVWSD